MSGRLFRMDDYRKGNGSGNGRSTADLLRDAELDFFDHHGREFRHDRIRASMHVLLGDEDTIQERIREGVEMGGLIRAIPPSARFPMETDVLAFRSEEEFREFTDEETARQLIASQQKERAKALAAYRAWATELLRDLTLIAETRLSGIPPEEVITTEHLRMVLATEMVSQQMMTSISETRYQVQKVIQNLMNQSEAGIKAVPLAASMKEIGRLCQKMNRDMEGLSKAAAGAAGCSEEDKPQHHSGVLTLTQRARQVFAPFIKGNHVITLQQVHELEAFLLEAGNYNESIGSLLQDGYRAIQRAKEESRHREAQKIEEFLGFSQQVAKFERVTRALDKNFMVRASIVANTGAQNRVLLESTPPAMLEQAELESGLMSRFLLARRPHDDIDLVLPSANDLELG
ncbi:hypothetical protein JXD20_02565 [Candidatus Peregrinibacteria bacterium]|nr:hypothetical protein [Candidatus Peregrinibacteria bacterium]